MMKKLAPYRKFAVAAIGAAAVIATTYATSSPWANVIIAIAAALGVYGVPNQSKKV